MNPTPRELARMNKTDLQALARRLHVSDVGLVVTLQERIRLALANPAQIPLRNQQPEGDVPPILPHHEGNQQLLRPPNQINGNQELPPVIPVIPVILPIIPQIGGRIENTHPIDVDITETVPLRTGPQESPADFAELAKQELTQMFDRYCGKLEAMVNSKILNEQDFASVRTLSNLDQLESRLKKDLGTMESVNTRAITLYPDRDLNTRESQHQHDTLTLAARQLTILKEKLQAQLPANTPVDPNLENAIKAVGDLIARSVVSDRYGSFAGSIYAQTETGTHLAGEKKQIAEAVKLAQKYTGGNELPPYLDPDYGHSYQHRSIGPVFPSKPARHSPYLHQSNVPPKRCFYCSKVGHIESNCVRKRSGQPPLQEPARSNAPRDKT